MAEKTKKAKTGRAPGCPICKDETAPINKLKACNHAVCRQCKDGMVKWLRLDCPLCRTPFANEDRPSAAMMAERAAAMDEEERAEAAAEQRAAAAALVSHEAAAAAGEAWAVAAVAAHRAALAMGEAWAVAAMADARAAAESSNPWAMTTAERSHQSTATAAAWARAALPYMPPGRRRPRVFAGGRRRGHDGSWEAWWCQHCLRLVTRVHEGGAVRCPICRGPIIDYDDLIDPEGDYSP